MKKLILIAIGVLGTVGIAQAALWNYYQEQGLNLPSVSDRIVLATQCDISGYIGSYSQNLALERCLRGQSLSDEIVLGSTLPIAGSTYTLAGSGISGSATSITLNSFTITQSGQKIQDSDLSDTFYVTLEPGNTKKQEIVSCTTVTQNSGGTATLSGCSRGMSPISPYTASTTLAFTHGGGTQVIFSDAPQLFNLYSAKANNETIGGVWTYSVFPVIATSTVLPTTNGQFATKYYVDTVGAGGFTSVNVSTTRGLSVDGSSPEKVGINASSTLGGAFDGNGAYYQKTTTGLSNGSNGIGIDYANNNTWTGTNTFGGTTTLATTTINNATISSSTIVGNLVVNGSTTINGFIPNYNYTLTASSSVSSTENLKASADTERIPSIGNGSYTLVKSIRVPFYGSYNVLFDLHSGASQDAFGKIYVNGVAAGTERHITNNTNYTTFAETINVSAGGDYIQLYQRNSYPSGNNKDVYLRDFRIYYTLNQSTPTSTVITD